MTTSDTLRRAWPEKCTSPQTARLALKTCYLGNAGKVAVSSTAGASKQNQGGRRGRRAELAFWEMKLVEEWHLRKPLKRMESGEKDALRLSRRDWEPRDTETQEHGGFPQDTKRGITPVNVTYSPKAQLSLQTGQSVQLKDILHVLPRDMATTQVWIYPDMFCSFWTVHGFSLWLMWPWQHLWIIAQWSLSGVWWEISAQTWWAWPVHPARLYTSIKQS